MYFSYTLHSREDLIALARHLGEAMKTHAREKPWIVCLNGDESSGKELIPLSIDTVFTPGNYPHGVTRDLSADNSLASGAGYDEHDVVFNNFRRIIHFSKAAFDTQLNDFVKENSGTKVLVASNIERTITGDFNYEAQGLNSDRLDVAIQVYKTDNSFGREIRITVEDANLATAIENYRPECRQNQSKEEHSLRIGQP